MTYSSRLFVAFAATSLLLACSSSPDEELSYDCDGDLQTNTVDASQWVQDNTDIEQYRYESDPDADIIDLHLLDDSEHELGTLHITGFFGTAMSAEDQEPHVIGRQGVEARFEPRGDGEPIEIFSDAVISNEVADEFRTRTLLERGDHQVIVRSDFEALDCYASEKPQGAQSHPCAWPAPVFDPEFSVPTCGFDVNPGLAAAPNLRAVEYRTPSDIPAETGGFLVHEEGVEATLDAVMGGRIIEEHASVAQWLDETGAGEIIGTEAERLFSATYADPAWMDHVEAHAATCRAEEFDEISSELESVRQAQMNRGFSCESDSGMWQYSALEGDIDTVRQAGSGKCDEDCADACGKPHLRTWDGSSFPFHAAGEFILATAEVGAPYEIQARLEPVDDLTCRDDVEACQQVTVITAVAMKVGDTRVAIYRDESPHPFIDGEPISSGDEDALQALPDGGSVHRRNSGNYRIDWPGVEALEVTNRGPYLDLKGILRAERFGQVAGVWGYYTNISGDDFRMRSGEVLEKPFDFEEFYDEFANSWRVDDEESLFDYEEGMGTDDFTIPELPEVEVSIDDLPEELQHEAEAACSRVTGHPERNWCIFNVICMCDDDLAESLEGLSAHDSLTDLHPEAPLTITGDLCLEEPGSFEYQASNELTCPPEADPCIHVVREQSGVELADDLRVDAADIGVYASEDSLEEITVDGGTKVDSYLIHANEVPQGTGLLEGEALCSEEILGVIATDDGLAATDSILGLPDADYNDGERAPDFLSDEFEILDSGSGARVVFDSEDGITEVRVITRAAGEGPGSAKRGLHAAIGTPDRA